MSADGERASAGHAGGTIRPAAGTETYLFTDIEGSTRLLQRLGADFPQLLLEQRALLLGAVEQGGGREQGERGDGSFIVFPSAKGAVAAAAAAQRAFAGHDWPGGVQVRVRMGLHSGESAVADGVYSGLDVFRASRIAAAAHGGQVLLSQATCQLVERGLPEGQALRDLGSHALEGLEHAEHLFQLVIAGMPSEFPPLKSLDARRFDLPSRATPFVGRDREMADVRSLLQRGDVPLLTLTGPGGIGKTRLALEAAAGVMAAFPDGIAFVPLETLTDPSGVPDRIAEALAITDHGTDALEAVEAHLRGRRMLLLLDNFEHLAAGSDVVARLVQRCSALTVLVTSRVRLRLSGEREYPVPPLTVPEPGAQASLDQLAAVPAVALFVQRAQAVRPGFDLREHAAEVARICADLDGLPLAIELAAARVRLFSPKAILARLSRRLDLLTGGARDLPARQRALRDTIAWSVELLSADERAYLRRLACFSGGIALDAVDPVCNANRDLEVGAEEAVAALVDNSLLGAADGPDGEPRFTMLATIRSYAEEQLSASEEEARVRSAHAAHFLALTEEAAPFLTGDRQRAWLDRLDQEHDNLRAALAWLESSGDHAAALRLGTALWRFWTARGQLREGGERLQALLALPGAQERSSTRARALHGAGTILAERSDYGLARQFLDASLAIWRERDDASGIGHSLNSLSWLEIIEGRFPRAEELATEAAERSRSLGDLRAEAVARHNLAWIALMRGRYEAAHHLTERAAELRRRAGDHRGAAYMQVSLAHIETIQGRFDDAAAHVDAGRAVLRDLGDTQIGAWATQVHARVALARGDHERAFRDLHEARALWAASGNQDALSRCLADLAEAELYFGSLERAAQASDESLAISGTAGGASAFTSGLPVAASVALALGDPARAEALLEEALTRARAVRAPLLEADVLEGRARVAGATGDAASAVRAASRAAAIRDRIGAPLRPDLARRHSELLDALRTSIGEEAFAAAWAEARPGVAFADRTEDGGARESAELGAGAPTDDT
jgi:predicted ATPase/class 3 adenylate cyclase